jgi:hypothetical protein
MSVTGSHCRYLPWAPKAYITHCSHKYILAPVLCQPILSSFKFSSRIFHFDYEERGRMFLHAVGICLPNYTVSNSKRHKADIHRLERYSSHPIITRCFNHLTNIEFNARYAPCVTVLSLCHSSTQPPCLYWWEKFKNCKSVCAAETRYWHQILHWSSCTTYSRGRDNAEVPTKTCMFSLYLRHPPACSSKYRLVLWVHRKIDRVHPEVWHRP